MYVTAKQKELIISYWSKRELGRQMLASHIVTDDELLFLIPNNVKRRYGVPAYRCVNKHGKRKHKKERKRYILNFRLYELFEELCDEIFPKKIDEHFGQFVSCRDVSLGDRNIFGGSL